MNSDFNSQQTDYWDVKSGSYSRLNRNHLKKISEIASFLEMHAGMKVLEVGVGTGEHAEFILSRYNVNFYGVDISQGMINSSGERLKQYKAVDLRVANGESLPFEDGFFDAVFCTATLHHLEKPENGISEMFRVLKTGGRLIAIEPNIYFPKNLYQALFIPEERNNLLITQRNLKKWGNSLNIKNLQIGYFIYTIPFPKFLFSFYDFIDRVFAKIPVLRKLAIQIYLRGNK